MKWSETPKDFKEIQQNYIEERWKQLGSLEKEWGETVVKYLFLINAGGAVAVLGFLGAIKELRALVWLYPVLACFVLGVVLTGVLKIWMFHRVSRIYRYWREDVKKFHENEIDWAVLINNDELKSRRYNRIVALGYACFGCFLLGSVIATFNMSELQIGAKNDREKNAIATQSASAANSREEGKK